MKGKVRKIIIGSFIGVTILAAGIKTNHEMRLISESREVQAAIEGSQMVSVKKNFHTQICACGPKFAGIGMARLLM